MNLTIILVGRERYAVAWADGQQAEARAVCAKWASDPSLSFTWWHCCVAVSRIREQVTEAKSRIH